MKKQNSAKELVALLLQEKLIASATIDENNVSYKLENNLLTEKVFSVITAQSKSLLFSEIVKAVESKFGEDTPINSTPIVGSNRFFDDTIKMKTIQI